jgi:CDP-paratose 2-epimerase
MEGGPGLGSDIGHGATRLSRVLVTGGAGFIGANLADALIRQGHEVAILDNLSRRGTEQNLEWLRRTHGDRFEFRRADTREMADLVPMLEGRDLIFHLAAQVAVTHSVQDPGYDFDVNARGSVNVLEAAREAADCPTLVFTSTNKVYGGMEDVRPIAGEKRYSFPRQYRLGVPESRPLDFHSPYGCSKGCADQYFRDYARIFRVKTVVLRMSCIYGTRQFGNEDQGWVAHFLISALKGRKINIYGDGKQVRDVLYVDDLIRLMCEAVARIDEVNGRVYNVGGGPENTISLLELLDLIHELTGARPETEYADWRPGDQPVYISDIRKAERELGWRPRIGVREGVERLLRWIEANPALFG